MAKFIIDGDKELEGEIEVQGAKNEALQVIAATLLTEDEIIIENVPEILDVLNLHKILSDLGVEIKKLGEGIFSYRAKKINLDYLKTPSFILRAQKLRGSILIVGPLLARFGYALFIKPGGDKIGRRHLDVHIEGLKALGAKLDYDLLKNLFLLRCEKLKGNYILLSEPSVTGTANVIMASVLAEGTTTIFNAACEPYIQQLCKMLNNMGAKIKGIGSNLLTIEGVSKLHGTRHKILPDFIEVGSFIGLAAITKSNLVIKNVCYENLGIIPKAFQKLGIPVSKVNEDDIHIPPLESYEISTFLDGSILTLYDAPWPGISPDLLPILLVTAIQAKGTVLIHQKMFESRLFFVDRLIDMGAQIILCDPHRAVIIGFDRKQKLQGIEMRTPDIRAGIAMLIAALSAEGVSVIHNVEQIERGYYKIDERLKKIGAKIIKRK